MDLSSRLAIKRTHGSLFLCPVPDEIASGESQGEPYGRGGRSGKGLGIFTPGPSVLQQVMSLHVPSHSFIQKYGVRRKESFTQLIFIGLNKNDRSLQTCFQDSMENASFL